MDLRSIPPAPESQSRFQRALNRVHSRSMLALIGKRGSGKTRLAAEAAREFNRRESRYADMLPTILIANLRPEELMTQLGESIQDRFQEIGGVLEFNNDSFRMQP